MYLVSLSLSDINPLLHYHTPTMRKVLFKANIRNGACLLVEKRKTTH